MIEKIKADLKNLPHVKKVWVVGNEFFIHHVKGGKEIDLTTTEQPTVTIFPEVPVKKSKK